MLGPMQALQLLRIVVTALRLWLIGSITLNEALEHELPDADSDPGAWWRARVKRRRQLVLAVAALIAAAVTTLAGVVPPRDHPPVPLECPPATECELDEAVDGARPREREVAPILPPPLPGGHGVDDPALERVATHRSAGREGAGTGGDKRRLAPKTVGAVTEQRKKNRAAPARRASTDTSEAVQYRLESKYAETAEELGAAGQRPVKYRPQPSLTDLTGASP